MANTTTICPGCTIHYDNEPMRVVECPPRYLHYKLVYNDSQVMFDRDEFNHLKELGRIVFNNPLVVANTARGMMAAGLPPQLIDLYRMCNKHGVGQSEKKLQHTIDYAMHNTPMGKLIRNGDIKLPSPRTLLRQLKKFAHFENEELRPVKERTSSFAPEKAAFCEEHVALLYCKRTLPSKTHVHQSLNRLLAENHFDPVSYSYVLKVIKGLHPIDVMIARKGRLFAKRHFKDYSHYIIPDYPLERVELDGCHIHADVMYQGELYKKVIIFAIIDICTRCIVGLSFLLCKTKKQSEKSSAVLECIRATITHSVELPGSNFRWHAFGFPDEIVLDPGMAMNNQNIKSFCEEHAITLTVTPAKHPATKPFIERFFRTFRDRIGFDIPNYERNREQRAVDVTEVISDKPIEFDDFRAICFDIVLQKYHHSPHAGLEGKTPAEAWDSLQSTSSLHRELRRELSIDLHAGEIYKGTIQKVQGLQRHNLYYSSKELQVLRGYLLQYYPTRKPEVEFRFDMLDVSKIIVSVPHDIALKMKVEYLIVSSAHGFTAKTHLADVVDVSKLDALVMPLIPKKWTSSEQAQEQSAKRLSTKRTKSSWSKLDSVEAKDTKRYAENLQKQYLNHNQSLQTPDEDDLPDINDIDGFNTDKSDD